MNRKPHVLQIGCGGIIQRYDLSCVADWTVAQQNPYGLNWTAGLRVQCRDNVQNSHYLFPVGLERNGMISSMSFTSRCYLPRNPGDRLPQTTNIFFKTPCPNSF